MFRKKEILYFVDPMGKIIKTIKSPRMIPKKSEIVIFPENKNYNVLEVVYTLDKNSYICWVYLNGMF